MKIQITVSEEQVAELVEALTGLPEELLTEEQSLLIDMLRSLDPDVINDLTA